MGRPATHVDPEAADRARELAATGATLRQVARKLWRENLTPFLLHPAVLQRAMARPVERQRSSPLNLELARPENSELARPEPRPCSRPIAERVILDLCGGTGSWSEPYRQAGYPVELVTLPGKDVRLYRVPRSVWGVLAAPPCNEFSSARNMAPTPRDVVRGMELVNACLRVIFQARPRWWALENPRYGVLSHFLGKPRMSFDPADFGDPWKKGTALWGEFEPPRRRPVQVEGHWMEMVKGRTERARTPAGFAGAFFEANR